MPSWCARPRTSNWSSSPSCPSCCSAVVFLAFAWQLPGREAVVGTFARVERVGAETTEQVRGLQTHFHDWSDRQLAAGEAFVTPSAWGDETVLRWCIVNPQTTVDDLASIVASLGDD